MLFFINPAKRRRAAKVRAIPKTIRRALRRKAATRGQKWFGVNPMSGVDTRGSQAPGSRTTREGRTMATRRRRNSRGRFVAGGGAPRRRRRRRHVTTVARRRRRHVAARSYAANPPRHRRRRITHRRRRYARNPGLVGARGIVGALTQGVKDGGAVVIGQVIARKFRGAVTGMLPDASKGTVLSGAGYVGLSVAGAVAVSMVARRVLPNYARMIAAGAFSEAINAVLAQTPVASYLGAFPQRRVVIAPAGAARRVGAGAWPRSGYNVPAGRDGLGAWPVRSVGMPVVVG